VQLPPGTDAGGFTTLTGHLVDAAFDEGVTSKDDLYRTLQFFDKASQLLAKATKRLVFLSLHVNTHHSIQREESQEGKTGAMGKNLHRSKIIEGGERAFGSLLLVSELQIQ
jgi:hypothetical protein